MYNGHRYILMVEGDLIINTLKKWKLKLETINMVFEARNLISESLRARI